MIKRNIIDRRGKDKELNNFEIAVCDNQGLLFQDCEYDFEADAEDFVNQFMHSDIATSMDNTLSLYHNCGTAKIGADLLKASTIRKFNGSHRNADSLYWMGYIYRYWVWWLGTNSKDVYSMADYQTMSAVYLYMHTLSPESAIIKLADGVSAC